MNMSVLFSGYVCCPLQAKLAAARELERRIRALQADLEGMIESRDNLYRLIGQQMAEAN